MREPTYKMILPSLLVDKNIEGAKEINQRIKAFLARYHSLEIISICESYNKLFAQQANFSYLIACLKQMLKSRNQATNSEELNTLLLLYKRAEQESCKQSYKISNRDLIAAATILHHLEKIVGRLGKLIVVNRKRNKSLHDPKLPSSLIQMQKGLELAIQVEKNRIQSLELSRLLNAATLIEKGSIKAIPIQNNKESIQKFYQVWARLPSHSPIKQILAKNAPMEELDNLSKKNYWLSSVRQGLAQRRYFAFRWCYLAAQQAQLEKFSLKDLHDLQIILQVEQSHAKRMRGFLWRGVHKEACIFNDRYQRFVSQLQQQIIVRRVNLWLNLWQEGRLEELQNPGLYNGLAPSVEATFRRLLRNKLEIATPQHLTQTLQPLLAQGLITAEQISKRLAIVAQRIIVPNLQSKVNDWLELQSHPWFEYLEKSQITIYHDYKIQLENKHEEEKKAFYQQLKQENYTSVCQYLEKYMGIVTYETSILKPTHIQYFKGLIQQIILQGYALVENVVHGNRESITTLQPYEELSEKALLLTKQISSDQYQDLKILHDLIKQKAAAGFSIFRIPTCIKEPRILNSRAQFVNFKFY